MAKKYNEAELLLSKQHYPLFVCTKEECELLKQCIPALKKADKNQSQRALCSVLSELDDWQSVAALKAKIKTAIVLPYLCTSWEGQAELLTRGGEDYKGLIYFSWVRLLWITKLLNYSKKFHYSTELEKRTKNKQR